MGLLVSLPGTCLGLHEIADLSPRMHFCGKHIDLPPRSPTQDPLFCLPAFPQTTPVPFQPLLCPCHGQCILYEAVKFDDSFPCQCGPHAGPSVIYGTDPPAASSLITNERKEKERSQGGGGSQDGERRRLTGHGTGEKGKNHRRPERKNIGEHFVNREKRENRETGVPILLGSLLFPIG